MSNFPNTAETTDSLSADFYLLRQGTIDVKQNRETLAAGVSNSRWASTADYDEGSNTVGSDGLDYKAVQDSGPGTGAGAVDPTTDDGTYWQASNDLYLQAANNLSDLDSASAARVNLGMANAVIQQGRNANGEYRVWNNGYREVWAIGLMPSGTTAPVTGTFPITFASLSTIRVMPSTEFITSQVAQGITVPEAEIISTSTYSYKALSLDANGNLAAPAEDISMVTYAAGF